MLELVHGIFGTCDCGVLSPVMKFFYYSCKDTKILLENSHVANIALISMPRP